VGHSNRAAADTKVVAHTPLRHTPHPHLGAPRIPMHYATMHPPQLAAVYVRGAVSRASSCAREEGRAVCALSASCLVIQWQRRKSSACPDDWNRTGGEPPTSGGAAIEKPHMKCPIGHAVAKSNENRTSNLRTYVCHERGRAMQKPQTGAALAEGSCTFSPSVSYRDTVTCDDASGLRRCHRAFVSNLCHFFGTPLPIPWPHIQSLRGADQTRSEGSVT
jgi:hypothetical protein